MPIGTNRICRRIVCVLDGTTIEDDLTISQADAAVLRHEDARIEPIPTQVQLAHVQDVVGIDASLTGTALVGPSTSPVLDGLHMEKVSTKGLTGPTRLAYIRDAVLDQVLTKMHGISGYPPLIVLEGYAYGRHNKAHQIGELGGVLRLAFHEEGLNVIEVSPPTLKKFVTGKGNAAKDQMIAAVTHRTGHEIGDNDLADAIGLYSIGLALQGAAHPLGALPQTHLTALDKLTLPTSKDATA